ncbi:MAG: hypothetical protein K2M80_00610, partial [Muribaculaceae bacterium]|nr:hypothetical protein [Muribaculaceae bacterium]
LPALSPMIYYPRADAVEARITFISDNGKNLGVTLPLRRLSNDFGACAVNDHGEHLLLSEVSSAPLLSPATLQVNLPCALAITKRGCEGTVLSATVAEASGKIVDLLEVDRRASAWESNRRRLYVATAGGLDGVSVSDDYTSQRWERLDPRGAVASPSLVATPGARYPVAALLGDDVAGIKSGTVTTVMDAAATGSGVIGWDCVNNELWCSDPGANSTIVIPSLGDFHYTFTGIEVARLQSHGQGLLIADSESRLYDTSAEAADENTIECHTCTPYHSSSIFTTARLCGVNAAILSPGKSPSLEITGAYEPIDNFAADTVPQLTPLTRVGYMRRSAMPTVIRGIIAPATPYIVTTIKGTATAGATVGDVALQFAETVSD